MDVEAQNGHHVDVEVYTEPSGERALKKGRSALSKAFLSAGMPVTFKVGIAEPSCSRPARGSSCCRSSPPRRRRRASLASLT